MTTTSKPVNHSPCTIDWAIHQKFSRTRRYITTQHRTAIVAVKPFLGSEISPSIGKSCGAARRSGTAQSLGSLNSDTALRLRVLGTEIPTIRTLPLQFVGEMRLTIFLRPDIVLCAMCPFSNIDDISSASDLITTVNPSIIVDRIIFSGAPIRLRVPHFNV